MNPEVFSHYKVGIPHIDEDHQEILCLIESIVRLLYLGGSKHEEASPLLKKLRVKVIEHYASEEKMMEEIGYPFLKYHKEVHQKLLEELEKAISVFDQVGGFKRREVEAFYRATFGHIDTMDMQYVAFFEAWKEAQAK